MRILRILPLAMLALAFVFSVVRPTFAYTPPPPPPPAWEFPNADCACGSLDNPGQTAWNANHWAVELVPGTWLSVYNGFGSVTGTRSNIQAPANYSPAQYAVSNTDGQFQINVPYLTIVECSDNPS